MNRDGRRVPESVKESSLETDTMTPQWSGVYSEQQSPTGPFFSSKQRGLLPPGRRLRFDPSRIDLRAVKTERGDQDASVVVTHNPYSRLISFSH